MKVVALKNTTNRPLELVFGEQSERIPKGQLGKFHAENEWNSSFAKKQADEFVKRHEAKYIDADSSNLDITQLADPSLKRQKKQNLEKENKEQKTE